MPQQTHNDNTNSLTMTNSNPPHKPSSPPLPLTEETNQEMADAFTLLFAPALYHHSWESIFTRCGIERLFQLFRRFT